MSAKKQLCVFIFLGRHANNMKDKNTQFFHLDLVVLLALTEDWTLGFLGAFLQQYKQFHWLFNECRKTIVCVYLFGQARKQYDTRNVHNHKNMDYLVLVETDVLLHDFGRVLGCAGGLGLLLHKTESIVWSSSESSPSLDVNMRPHGCHRLSAPRLGFCVLRCAHEVIANRPPGC